MAEPTLEQIFGVGATQDATTVTIPKSGLTGLTASATNTAESLLVAILLKAKSNLTATNQEANPEQSITIEDSFESLTNRNNQTYRQKSYSINLEKIDNSTGVNPNDY